MDKTARTDHPIHELLAQRWSPRAFEDRDVSDESVSSMLEAARWAASCFNAQPWFFIVASQQNAEEYERMLGCLVEGNRAWAGKAPVLMLSVARMSFEHNDKPNRHAFHDVGQAVANLSVQATELGLSVHQMAGFDRDKAREVFEIPDGFEPVAAIAVGYRGEPDGLPDALRERETAERVRRPVTEFAFRGRWGGAGF